MRFITVGKRLSTRKNGPGLPSEKVPAEHSVRSKPPSSPPFAIPLTIKGEYERGLKRARATKAMEAAIDASLTLQERRALDSIKEQDSIESRNPIPIKQKVNRKSKPSPDTLRENFTKFMGNKN